MARNTECQECKGTGVAEYIGEWPRPCDACGGSGLPPIPKKSAGQLYYEASVANSPYYSTGVLSGVRGRRREPWGKLPAKTKAVWEKIATKTSIPRTGHSN